jgi:hypothetical protein
MKDAIPIIVALISGFISLVAALIAVLNTRSVERLKAQLSSEAAVQGARRDYEYDALKRLYAEFEPVRFQLIETCENAISFIENLAWRATHAEVVGSVPGGTYLRMATVYHLLLPAACFRILSRRLTLIDLELSQPVYLQYLLAKEAYLSFSRDAEIATIAGLDYTPYVHDWRTKRQEDPHRYRRQGFALGRLDNALDQLINQEGEHERLLSFGEFEEKMRLLTENAGSEKTEYYSSALGAPADLFAEFEIDSRPVLWRMLVVQYILYNLLLKVSRDRNLIARDLGAMLNAIGDINVLDIGTSAAALGPIETARRYVLGQVLPRLEARVPQANS